MRDDSSAMGMGNGRAPDDGAARPMRAVAATLATPGQPRAHLEPTHHATAVRIGQHAVAVGTEKAGFSRHVARNRRIRLAIDAERFAGAIAAFLLVALLARASGPSSATGQIILAGIAGSQLFNALTAFLITKSASAEQARGIMFWLLGNLSGVRWPSVWLAVPVALVGLAVCLWHRRALDAFTFGSDSAASLGIPVRRVQFVLVGCAALVTAVMVSIVGSIGFVGLVIPHAVRLLLGTGHSRLLPASALGGALFLIAADVLSRTLIKGQVIPVGVVTALVGAPVFALILIGRRNAR